MWAAAVVAVAPGAALLTIAATQLALDNANERIPPSAHQVLYYPSGSATDREIHRIVADVAPQAERVEVFPAQGPDKEPYLALAGGIGKVSALASVHDLELLLDTNLDDAAVHTLESGGVVWTGADHGPRLVTEKGEVPVPASVDVRVDERWSRDSEGFMLLGGPLDLQADPSAGAQVYVGLDGQQIRRIPSLLAEHGLDARSVLTPRPETVHRLDPILTAVVAGLSLLGTAMLIGADRGRVATLRRQASDLSALGVPRSWTARSLLAECGPSVVSGALTGIIVASIVTVAGLARLGFAPVVPVWVVVGYLAAVGTAVAIVVVTAGRTVSAREA
ncbi:MAG: hypothetical protein ACTMIR_08280 [Cellulomonadaceae bacterium]